MQKINILVTAASRRVALIRAFGRALQRLELNGNVVTTDLNCLSPGLYFGNRHYIAPLTTDPGYIPLIKSICANENIRLLIPTIDDELPIFGRHRQEFEEMGVRVAVSCERTGRVCNDKYASYHFFKERGLPFARTWLPEELDRERLEYPLFLKPRSGRGSVGAYRIKNERELDFFLEYVSGAVVQEYLTGTEYTIDVLADFEGRVISVVPRERMVVRSGVSDRGQTFRHSGLTKLAVETAEAIELRGAANIQVKLEGDDAVIFEVNPRFSGGIPLTIAAGADFPGWLVEMCLGRGPAPRIGDFTDGIVMACYEEALFLPFKGDS
ncbi:MAG: ATP-grasp domain-containing protein [Acidobacteriota bacterium]|jgi:carbamoyl-phosphate synthase large subunit|nr:ATP-grasp domain-containing protein [Acidobacteriota bacterium]